MDQIKIGKFIANMRKNNNMTQKQLAAMLNISEKTISKWETGNGLPDTSLMLPLCEILGITVNDLLSGEKIKKEEYNKKVSENIMNLLKEREENKKKLIISFITVMIGVMVLVVSIILSEYCIEDNKIKILLIAFGTIIFLICGFNSMILDMDTGTYKCSKCNNHFRPNFRNYIFGAHFPMRRYLKCPNCKRSSFCKRELTKNN